MELSVTDSLSFPGIVRPRYYALVLLSLEDVTVHAGHKVLVEADDNNTLIVANHKGILGKHLRHNPIIEIYFTKQ